MNQPGAAIVGAAYSDIARHSQYSLGELLLQAAQRAADDAGIDLSVIDGLSNYPNPSRVDAGDVEGVDLASINFLAAAVPSMRLRWACSITQGTVTASLSDAAHAVIAGACRYVLVWRAMHNPRQQFGFARTSSAEGKSEFLAPYGLSTVIMNFGMLFSRYLAMAGKKRDDMADFIVQNRSNAARNPEAVFFQSPLTTADYLSSPIISTPLGYLDCDMPVDGVGALIVTRTDIARSLRHPPAYIAASTSLGLPRSYRPVMTWEDFLESAHELARSIWGQAALGPLDMQHINLYDGFSYFVPMLLEGFGFCESGAALDFISDGNTGLKGRFPLNTSGGALGMGRLHGTPQVIEAVRQVQGRAGDRQVDAVTNALAVSGGMLTGAGALILSNEPPSSSSVTF